jgi:hypothetical protein
MDRDSGSVTMWMVGVIALVTVLALSTMGVSASAVDAGRAQTAADLAALAGVTEDRAGAATVAESNGATLLTYDVRAEVVSVTVRREGVVATAHATGGENPAGP